MPDKSTMIKSAIEHSRTSECAKAYFADQGMTHNTIYTLEMQIEFNVWRRAWNAALEKAKSADWVITIDDHYIRDVRKSLEQLEIK